MAEERHEIIWMPLAAWAGLLLLLGATLGYAYLPHAPTRIGVALLAAVLQAGLIAVVFMRLPRASGLVRLAATAGFAWLSLLFLFSFADFLTR